MPRCRYRRRAARRSTNGRHLQSSYTEWLIFVSTIIAPLSEFVPLQPGDVILTGTRGWLRAPAPPAPHASRSPTLGGQSTSRPTGCAGEDNAAGLERDELRQQGDDGGHVEDQPLSVGRLHVPPAGGSASSSASVPVPSSAITASDLTRRRQPRRRSVSPQVGSSRTSL